MPVNGNTLEGYSEQLKYNDSFPIGVPTTALTLPPTQVAVYKPSLTGVIDETGKDAMGEYVITSHAAGFITEIYGT